MAKSLNKIQLIGYLASDPQLKQNTKGGKAPVEITLVTTDGTKEYQHANFHLVVLWGANADNALKYLKKGSRVFVEGTLDYSEYKKDGVKIKAAKVVGFNLIYLSGGAKPEGGAETEAPW